MIEAVVLLFLLCSNSGGAVEYICRKDKAPSSVNFTPAKGGIQGRYTLQLCTLSDPEVTLWNVDLFYFEDPARCHNTRRPDHMHSVLKDEPIRNPFNNCTTVCYEVDFDLIFTGCYNIHSLFETDKKKKRPEDSYITINNNLTLAQYKNNKPLFIFTPDSKDVQLHWFLGLIPVTDFEVKVAPLKPGSNELAKPLVDVTKHCKKTEWNEVRCYLSLPFGNYHANYRHHALWSSLLNEQTDVTFNFSCPTSTEYKYKLCFIILRDVDGPCNIESVDDNSITAYSIRVSYVAQPVHDYTELATPKLGGDTTFVWWVCGGALLATAVLFAAAMARKALRTRNYHKHVLESWRRARSECEAPRPLDARLPKPNILVLYAREGEHGQRAVSALKSLLQQVTGAQVLDIFSPEVSSLAAPAPGAWLRHTVLGVNTRVVLLQSPATQALFATNMNQSNLNLQEPLLGRRAMYRCPQFGDQLLQLALRLISETVAEHHDYSKYYLATYNSLESDIVQQVVPYRRYVLPAAVTTLLRDLAQNTSPGAATTTEPDPALLQHFYDSVDRFVTHVNDNPDYLMEELMIM